MDVLHQMRGKNYEKGHRVQQLRNLAQNMVNRIPRRRACCSSSKQQSLKQGMKGHTQRTCQTRWEKNHQLVCTES